MYAWGRFDPKIAGSWKMCSPLVTRLTPSCKINIRFWWQVRYLVSAVYCQIPNVCWTTHSYPVRSRLSALCSKSYSLIHCLVVRMSKSAIPSWVPCHSQLFQLFQPSSAPLQFLFSFSTGDGSSKSCRRIDIEMKYLSMLRVHLIPSLQFQVELADPLTCHVGCLTSVLW